MAKPRLIILIRHAQSEGNKNREIHQTIPDHRVKLTQDGWQQAYDAGRRLRSLLRADDTLHFFTSPYRRTRETTEGILATLTADEPEDGPSPFKRNNIKVYEEPRLREQDFGNFQPCSAEMERMWQERADYGHFFYRIPNGESAADAYDRVSGFNESLWRQFGEDDFSSVCVLVTHGLMSRVFLMKWYHWGVEYFEDLRNVNHCEFLIMRKEESGKYQLENNLRTWSELRRERAAQSKHKEADAKDGSKLDKAAAAAAATSSPVAPRRWGGCPNGCNHDKNFRIRSNLADLVKQDGVNVYPSDKESHANGHHATPHPGCHTNGTSTPASHSSTSLSTRRPAARRFASDEGRGPDAGPQIDITRAREEVVSSPDGTPSYISVEDRIRGSPGGKAPPPHDNKARRAFLHVGRDFGGTYSGHTSDADSSSSEDEKTRQRLAKLKIPSSSSSSSNGNSNGSGTTATNGAASNGDSDAVSVGSSGKVDGTTPAVNGHKREDSTGLPRHRMANRLGDSPVSSESDRDREREEALERERCAHCGEEHREIGEADEEGDEDLAAAEKLDRSILGSVY